MNPPDDSTHWQSSYLTPDSWTFQVSGQQVTMTLDNVKIQTNCKDLYIRVEGTTTNGQAPSAIKVEGNNIGKGDSCFSGTAQATVNGGTWTLLVDASLYPQPDDVVLTFTLPTGGQVTKAWAGDCCHQKCGHYETCPTVSEWGLAVLTLLTLAAATIVIARRRAATV
ncbi:MAG: IPTL-CTERM sorting domain-containing protein [Planctomycetota bacterium]